MIKRKKTRKIRIGNVFIGGNAPVAIQSMANTKTNDVEATVLQTKKLEKAASLLKEDKKHEGIEAMKTVFNGTDAGVGQTEAISKPHIRL